MIQSSPAAAPRLRCSALSLKAGEALAGSAAQAQTWFLLEYPGPWGSKALPESRIPGRVQEALQAVADAVPGGRVQLIKQGSGRAAGKIAFYVVLALEARPRMYHFELQRYADLLDLDLDGLAAGRTDISVRRVEEPLYLVCTNGRRDPCCARHGLPVWKAARQRAPARVWQTTHVGGHRFAANLVCLPHAIYYGRVQPEESDGILGNYEQGQISLERYRGRSCYTPVAQAAEAFLREQTGDLDLEAYRRVAERELAPDRWEVRFRAVKDSAIYALQVGVGAAAPENYLSCRTDRLSPLVRFSLEGMEVNAG